MAFKSSKTRVIVPVVEMTPMIDIIFLLIIFFMVAAQFSQQTRVEMTLPKELEEANRQPFDNLLVINILSDGDIVVDATQGAIRLEELKTIIESGASNNQLTWDTLLVRTDVECPSKQLNEVVMMLHDLKFPAVKIATVVK